MLQFSEKVNPGSDVDTNNDVGVNAIGNHQEKNALFRDEDFPFINSLENMTQKNQKIPQEPNSVQEIKEDHFRLESVKWRVASRKCHDTKRFR